MMGEMGTIIEYNWDLDAVLQDILLNLIQRMIR